ncbi:serine-type endopeptidase inhibitor activity [Nesidiocoris tenuis]|uniref:Spondin-1 n=1 Tax=Nesidiocoris tenuis TaxID=355587 RepID=A0ABN7B5N3_9HEMI|nr:serine-type endopeptidase inhibitor activity [Nesidiocoris tenuis]
MENTKVVKLVGGGRGTPGVAKFTWFSLSVEAGNRDNSPPGRLFLFGDSGTQYADACPNMISAASLAPKTEVTALWSAPARGAGCVVFRATVQEHVDVWYQDDGPLSKTLCEDIQQNNEEQPVVNDPCCACDEAKYEVSFEGLWSRHTHPKDFPESSTTRFSDVIGASHTTEYRFWEYGGRASEGLKQVAELGSTRRLETELKLKSQHIRTIIKARGISYPNVTSKTFAVFRVDNKHHLISLVSMIDPSPDWIVGVSGLELCLSNCSWLETKTLNLYPWDAGTDSGVTYTSPDMATEPQDHIRRITNSFPADPRSPFYDPTGEEMKPLARLVLTRQRLYEKSCSSDNADSSADETGEACDVEQWSSWSECSVTCGLGKRSRQRFYKDQNRAAAANCNKELTSRKSCYGSSPCKQAYGPSAEDDEEPSSDSMCAMTQWSEWGGCSVACGKGIRTRFRSLIHQKNWKKCRASAAQLVTSQDDECIGAMGKDCDEQPPEASALLNPVDLDQHPSTNCELSSWSEWSACSATCGEGTRQRNRSPVGPTRHFPECMSSLKETMPCMEQYSCQLTPDEAKEVCRLPKLVGPCRTGHVEKYYFDTATVSCKPFTYSGCRGNRNQFDTYEECVAACKDVKTEFEASPSKFRPFGDIKAESSIIDGYQTSGPYGSVEDCRVSPWSAWSPCSVTCGRGTRTKHRVIEVYSRNGGKACPKKLMRRKKCYLGACPHGYQNTQEDSFGSDYEEGNSQDDCVYSEWSAWSLCSATCGLNSVQQRARSIDLQKTPDPSTCLERLETRVCNVFPCRKFNN